MIKQFGRNVLNQYPTFSASAPSSQHGHGLVGEHLQRQAAGNQEQEGGHQGPHGLTSPHLNHLAFFWGV